MHPFVPVRHKEHSNGVRCGIKVLRHAIAGCGRTVGPIEYGIKEDMLFSLVRSRPRDYREGSCYCPSNEECQRDKQGSHGEGAQIRYQRGGLEGEGNQVCSESIVLADEVR